MHQVGLAHAHAAIQEERVVGFRGLLGNGHRGCAGKLVSRSAHKTVEGITRVQLRRCRPVEARLLRPAMRLRTRGRTIGVQARNLRRGRRREAAVLARPRHGGILIRGDERDVIEIQMQVFDRLLNEIAVAIRHMLEFRSRDAHIEHAFTRVTEARGLEPRIEGLPIYFLFERSQDLYPGIESDRRSNGNRHAQSS